MALAFGPAPLPPEPLNAGSRVDSIQNSLLVGTDHSVPYQNKPSTTGFLFGANLNGSHFQGPWDFVNFVTGVLAATRSLC